MGSYIALARKWRPAQFSDLVGQESVARTLMNSIRTDRLHHAYLLTGSRGIGKTSIARIFSKVIRCSARKEDSVEIRSCDQCANCKEIAASQSVDVLEIDGASNNGVDAVREIRDNARFLPSSGTKKIYIIDEVHMLTTAAFNALLKTLEEPPEHVLFVFATTEPQKIPATILSRCQKFDLKRVTPAQIQTRLTQVVAAEGIQSEPAALALVARAAEGSMRDSLSLLDQVIAYSSGNITVAATRESIGLIESQTVFKILEAVFKRDVPSVLLPVQETYQAGHDLRILAKALQQALHAILLLKVGTLDTALQFSGEFSQSEMEDLQTIAPLRTIEEIELFFQVFHQGLEWMGRAPHPKQVLDILLIKCTTAETLIFIDAPAAKNNSAQQSPYNPQHGQSGSKPLASPVTPKPTQSSFQSRTSANATTGQTGLTSFSGGSLAHQALPNPSHSTQTPQAFSVQQEAQTLFAPSQKSFGSSAAQVLVQQETQKSREAQEMKRNAQPLTLVPQPNDLSLNPFPASSEERTWEGWIQFIKSRRPMVGSALENALPVEGNPLKADETGAFYLPLVFQPTDAFFMQQLQARNTHDPLVQLSRAYFQTQMRFHFELREAASAGESLAAKRARERQEKEQAAKNAAINHPIILEARSLFGGELGPIELNL